MEWEKMLQIIHLIEDLYWVMYKKFLCAQSITCFRLFTTPWTGARQATLSFEFFRQIDWSGLSFPPPENLPNPGIKLASLASPTLTGGFFSTESPGKPHKTLTTQ